MKLERSPALDLEYEIDDSIRETHLSEFFTTWLAPVVSRSASLEGLRSMTTDGVLPAYVLTRTAYEMLNIPLPRGRRGGVTTQGCATVREVRLSDATAERS